MIARLLTYRLYAGIWESWPETKADVEKLAKYMRQGDTNQRALRARQLGYSDYMYPHNYRISS